MVFRMQHDTDDADDTAAAARFVTRVVAIASSWAALAQPHLLGSAVCEHHRALRAPEADALFALTGAWLAATYTPRVLFVLCTALQEASEDVQDSFFTVCSCSSFFPINTPQHAPPFNTDALGK